MSHTKKSIEAASNTEGKDPVKAFVHNENLTFKSCHRFAGRGLWIGFIFVACGQKASFGVGPSLWPNENKMAWFWKNKWPQGEGGSGVCEILAQR